MTEPARAPSRSVQRRPWIAPAILPILSRDARAGPNPINPEGEFANGS